MESEPTPKSKLRTYLKPLQRQENLYELFLNKFVYKNENAEKEIIKIIQDNFLEKLKSFSPIVEWKISAFHINSKIFFEKEFKQEFLPIVIINSQNEKKIKTSYENIEKKIQALVKYTIDNKKFKIFPFRNFGLSTEDTIKIIEAKFSDKDSKCVKIINLIDDDSNPVDLSNVNVNISEGKENIEDGKQTSAITNISIVFPPDKNLGEYIEEIKDKIKIEIENESEFNYLISYFKIHQDLETNYYLFSYSTRLPLKEKDKKAEILAGIGIFVDELDESQLLDIQTHFDRFCSEAITEIYNEYVKRVTSYYGLKSALAAIMSRNGSHNIGSHVLAAVGNSLNELPDDQILFKYIQNRMDYIAQITTEIPGWSYPVWFVRDLMRRFYMQRHLLNNIAVSEGLSAFEFQGGDVKNSTNRILIKIKHKGTSEHIIPNNSANGLINDVQIAIAGGIVGQHAFYTILENIIRNSAKHGWSRLNEKQKKEIENLIITIEIDDSPNDKVKFTIWDNVSNIFSGEQISDNDVRLNRLPLNEDSKEIIITSEFESYPIHQIINNKLGISFIDTDTGVLRKANWGLAEMKISTGFLNKAEIKQIGSNNHIEVLFNDDLEGLISAVPIKENIKDIVAKNIDNNPSSGSWLNKCLKGLLNLSDDKFIYRLGYKFAIPKPKEVLIWGEDDESVENKDSETTIKRISNGKIREGLDFEFIVLIDNGESKFINLLKGLYELSKESAEVESENGGEKKAEYDKLYSKILTEIETFPFRLFIVSDDLSYSTDSTLEFAGSSFLGDRLVFLKKTEYRGLITNSEESKVKLSLYVEWIKHLKRVCGNNSDHLKMLIYLSSNHGSSNEEFISFVFKNYKNDIIDATKCDKDIKNVFKDISFEEICQYNVVSDLGIDNKEDIIAGWIGRILSKEHEGHEAGDDIRDMNVPLNKSFEMYENLLGKLKKYFIKYEENIETLPIIYHANESENCDYKLDKEIADKIGLTVTTNEDDTDLDISFNRHELKDAQLYSEALSGVQIYFSLFSNPPKDSYAAQKIIIQLLETALLRILVVDERVAQYCYNNMSTMNEKYKKAGIFIPLIIKYKIKKEENQLNLVQNLPDNNDDIKSINLEEIKKNNYDVMIIHQGILDKIIKPSTKDEISRQLNLLKEKIPFILITSGRGEPEKISDDIKFFAFSNIESFLLKEYPEKFLLTQMMMKVIK